MPRHDQLAYALVTAVLAPGIAVLLAAPYHSEIPPGLNLPELNTLEAWLGGTPGTSASLRQLMETRWGPLVSLQSYALASPVVQIAANALYPDSFGLEVCWATLHLLGCVTALASLILWAYVSFAMSPPAWGAFAVLAWINLGFSYSVNRLWLAWVAWPGHARPHERAP